MKTTRISFLRLMAVMLGAMAVVAAGIWFVRPTVTEAATSVPGTPTFSGYVDVTNTPSYAFQLPKVPAQEFVTLSFVVADKANACTPSWGTYYTLDEANSSLDLERRIHQLELTGGQARVSFGGAANDELSQACTDVRALTVAYQSVVDRYNLTSIDLDIEGAALSNQDAAGRRAQAIKAVQEQQAKAGKPLAVWLTLPVSTSGLTAEGTVAVDGMLKGGVNLTGVNGMAMDFGGSKPATQSMSDAVIAASSALKEQVQSSFAAVGTSLDESQAWSKVGITPMIGQNDVAEEQFTIADATSVNWFARQHGVGLVSMWSMNRDSTCQSPLPTVITVVQNDCSGVDQGGSLFSSTLGDALKVTQPTGTASSRAQSHATSATDNPVTAPYEVWEPRAVYSAGQKVVWQGKAYEAAFYSVGSSPDAPSGNGVGAPWRLLGPVLPGDKPAAPAWVPTGTYPEWNAKTAYPAGVIVQFGNTPYESKWWTQAEEPGTSTAGSAAWRLVTPSK